MGIIKDMSNEMYHSTSGISSSAVKTVYKKSLAHWKGEKRTQTAAFTIGSATHAALLEPERDLLVKGGKTKNTKTWLGLKADLKPDQVLLTEVEYHVVNRMATSVLSNNLCRNILKDKDRQNEVSIFAEDPFTGLVIKCRPDCMIEHEGSLYDVKTTQDASPHGFARECQTYAYDLQAAHYIWTCQKAGLTHIKNFSFICVEKSAPYASHVHHVSEELLESATERMHRTLAVIAEAEVKDDYGTGWGEYTILEKPKWL